MNTHDIIIILDESGSMSMIKDDVIDSINYFIDEQRKNNNNSKLSLWKFNSSVTKVYDDLLLKYITKFDNYIPSGKTCLFDAIGTAITKKRNKDNFKDVICVIMTDGLENGSREYTKDNINDMISEMKENNWVFIYLGANQDSFSIAASYGISQNLCANFESTGEGFTKITRYASEKISNI